MHETALDDGPVAKEAADLLPCVGPPLRLAGIDEDDTWEPHLVRGID
ncbi:hypothetical protein [Streptomyces coriariae]|nr:hypothetical protein [Streptomyces coriariae]